MLRRSSSSFERFGALELRAEIRDLIAAWFSKAVGRGPSAEGLAAK